ncbi:MAG TPA: hypothetical protein VFN28_14335 [Amaricoccus sp.]|nr:hypothetical protein [Amaricoccus sp.]
MARSFGWMAAVALLAAATLPARAQMDPEEEQRCVWSCLANSPGAGSAEYNACVARLCMGDAAPAEAQSQPAAPAVPRAVWTAGAGQGGARYAGVELSGRSLTFLCQRGGPGLMAVAGLGGDAQAVGVTVDGRAHRLPFVARNGILYTAADPGSPILGALLGGSVAEVATRGGSAAFPLAGSGAAIRSALKGCGMPS